MTDSTARPDPKDIALVINALAADAPDQEYASIGYDPHTGDHQAAGPFPTRDAAQAYGEEVERQVNDEHAKREGLPDVIYTVGLHFTPEPTAEEQDEALYSNVEVDAAADALREYLDYDDEILAVAAEKALAAAATARPFSPRA